MTTGDNWVAWAGVTRRCCLFKNSEHQERGANEYHGVGGPLWVSDLPSRHELADAFISAGRALGAPLNEDFNGAVQEGAGYVQVTTRNGRRWSTAKAYLGLPNVKSQVKVTTGAFAKEIVVEDTHAVGVECMAQGQTKTARAWRGHSLRWSIQFSTNLAIVRDWPCRLAQEDGDSGRIGSAGRGRESLGSLWHRN